MLGGENMSDNDDVIRLLTEIRDNQREEIAWRRKAIEASFVVVADLLVGDPALAAGKNSPTVMVYTKGDAHSSPLRASWMTY